MLSHDPGQGDPDRIAEVGDPDQVAAANSAVVLERNFKIPFKRHSQWTSEAAKDSYIKDSEGSCLKVRTMRT